MYFYYMRCLMSYGDNVRGYGFFGDVFYNICIGEKEFYYFFWWFWYGFV